MVDIISEATVGHVRRYIGTGSMTSFDWSCSSAQSSPEMTSANDDLCDVNDVGATALDSLTPLQAVPGDCDGCRRPIVDRYFLRAVGRTWHVGGCLRCASCRRQLDSQTTCFVRAGLIYCRHDYDRLYGRSDSAAQSPSVSAVVCAGCGLPISAGDLVMRAAAAAARHRLVYHVACFRCCVCRRPLCRGQHYAVDAAARIYCWADCQRLRGSTACQSPAVGAIDDDPLSTADDHATTAESAADCNGSGSTVDVPATSPASRRLYRSRWKTRRTVHSASDCSGRRSGDCVEALRLCGGLGEASYHTSCSSHDSACGTPRQKRLRTSFKHHQLRILKTYFALNHNPDAKDLKQLSQKTGLGKRILQVWFQNARAKYRRNMQRASATADEQQTCSGDEPWLQTGVAASTDPALPASVSQPASAVSTQHQQSDAEYQPRRRPPARCLRPTSN